MREDVVPYVVSGIFIASCVLLVAGYGLYRKFVVKKTDYDVYVPGAAKNDFIDENVEMMTTGNGSFDNGDENGSAMMKEQTVVSSEPTAPPTKAQPPANNPFKNKPGNNPFNQQQAGYGAAP